MNRYYSKIKDCSKISTRSGSSLTISDEFYIISSKIISGCIFAQRQIQKIVYVAYSDEVHKAGQSLKEITSPKLRLNFLNSFNDISEDEELSVVFLYAKSMFCDVYDLRNILAHDTWLSSDQFPDSLLLCSLDEDARLLFASGKLIHIDGTKSEQVYKAIMRYIESIKIVSLPSLRSALKDIDLCNWCLQQISFIIDEPDDARIAELKKAFLIFKGVSHLFPENKRLGGTINSTSKKIKSINI